VKETARWRESLGDFTTADIDALLQQRLHRDEVRGGTYRVLAGLNRAIATAHQPGGPSSRSCGQCHEMWPCSHLRAILSDRSAEKT